MSMDVKTLTLWFLIMMALSTQCQGNNLHSKIECRILCGGGYKKMFK